MLRENQTVRRQVLTVFMFLGLSSLVLADQEADHNELRRMRSIYEDSLNTNDLSKIKPLMADGFSVVMISGEEIKSFDEMTAFWKRVWDLIGVGGSYHVKVVPDRTDFFGNVGISRGHNEEVFRTSKGKEFAVQAPWTVVSLRQNGEWKIFRVHEGLNPMDNVYITDLLKQTKRLFGAIGLVIGLVLGFFVGTLKGKKGISRPSAT